MLRNACDTSLVATCHIYSLCFAGYYYRSQRRLRLIFFTELAPFPRLLLFTDSLSFRSCRPPIVTLCWKQCQIKWSPFNFSNRFIIVTFISRPCCPIYSFRTMVPCSRYQHITNSLNKVLKTHSCPFVRDRHSHWMDHSGLLCYVCLWTHVIR